MNLLFLSKWILPLKCLSIRKVSFPYHLFIRLSANCPQCEKGNINPSAPLVITGLCLSCPSDNSNIAYQWRLYHVGDSQLSSEEECPQAHGGILDSEPSSTQKPFPTFTPTDSHIPTTRRFEGTTAPQPTSNKGRSHTTKPTDTPISRARFYRGSICQDPNQILDTTTPPRHSIKHPRWPAPGGSGSGSGGGIGSGSGRGSGSGSSSGVKPSYGVGIKKQTTKIPTTQTHLNVTTVAPVTGDDKGGGGGGYDVDDVYDPRYRPPSARHSSSIIRLQRRHLALTEKQTTTGLKRLNFVLLGKSLNGGHSYMVSFNVFDGKKEGKASVFFNTSNTPKCSMCRVAPAVGLALETSFQLTCSNWRVS